MSWQGWATLVLLILTFVLLGRTRLHPAVVLLGALIAAGLLQLAPLPQLLAGFSNESVIIVAAMFVVAGGLWRTGAVTLLAGRLFGIPSNERGALLRTLPPVVGASAFLNNTPIVAMMLPALVELARAGRLALSKLLIPLSYASILGGSLTLLGTSSNLVVAGQVADYNAAGGTDIPALGLFSPLPVMAAAVVLGVGFLVVLAPRMLPDRAGAVSAEALPVFRARFDVPAGSRLVGQLPAAAGLGDIDGRTLVARTADGARQRLDPLTPLRAGEQISFDVRGDQLGPLWGTIGLTPVGEDRGGRHRHRLVGAVVAASSELVGSIYADLVGETGTGGALVGVSRLGRPVERASVVEVGDLLALEVDQEWFYLDRGAPDFVLVKKLGSTHVRRTSRAVPAGLITLAMIVVSAFQVVPLVLAAPTAAFLIVAVGALPGADAVKRLDLGVLGALAAAIGLGAAVSASGLGAAIADLVVSVSAGSSYAALAAILVAGVALTNVITNTAAAALLFPIAVEVANLLDVRALPFVMAVLAAANFAFLSPTGYQTNLMVMEPGGYRLADFVRVGLPLTLITVAATWGVIPLVTPF